MSRVLDGGVRRLFGRAFSGIYDDGFIVQVVSKELPDGKIEQAEVGQSIKYHEPIRSAVYRSSSNMAENELEVIILAAGLKHAPKAGDRIKVDDCEKWQLISVKRDGARSQFIVRVKPWSK